MVTRERRGGGSLLADDRGYATVVSAGVIAAVVGLALVAAAVISATVNSHRAQVAADLAAVAGATALHKGHDACATARDTAKLNDAELHRCEVDGRDVVATARIRQADVTSRAGPL